MDTPPPATDPATTTDSPTRPDGRPRDPSRPCKMSIRRPRETLSQPRKSPFPPTLSDPLPPPETGKIDLMLG